MAVYDASLADRIPAGTDPDRVAELFIDWAAERSLDLYDAQEEAVLEILGGNHVVLATPTGSGKSLVAIAAHAAALARGDRSIYTAPIKALVSEKFFALARDFGAANVGMVTGDASVNADAPIICATAEILAHQALREGMACPFGLVGEDLGGCADDWRIGVCLLYTSPSPRDQRGARMPSSA